MAAEAVRIVSLTVTEKGYCHEPSTGRLNPIIPTSAMTLTTRCRNPRPVSSCARRRRGGRWGWIRSPSSAVTTRENGRVVRGVVLDLARLVDPALASWIEAKGAFLDHGRPDRPARRPRIWTGWRR